MHIHDIRNGYIVFLADSNYDNCEHDPQTGNCQPVELCHSFHSKERVYDLEDRKLFFDSKTILQEIVQGNSDDQVSYELIREEGPDHNKSFCTAVRIGEQIYGEGEGRTKKASEQQAAYQAILKLQEKR